MWTAKSGGDYRRQVGGFRFKHDISASWIDIGVLADVVTGYAIDVFWNELYRWAGFKTPDIICV